MSVLQIAYMTVPVDIAIHLGFHQRRHFTTGSVSVNSFLFKFEIWKKLFPDN
jgi:hypothetical protein